MPNGIENNQNKLETASANDADGSTNAFLDEVFDIRQSSKPQESQQNSATDVSKEVKDAAREIGDIITCSVDVQTAADNPELVKILQAAKQAGNLDQVVQQTNSVLGERDTNVSHSIDNHEFFGVLITKAISADSLRTNPSDTPTAAMTESELDEAADGIAKTVHETQSFGNEQRKAEIAKVFDRARENGQVEDLLAKINGDRLGDADVLGTHEFIQLVGGGKDQNGRSQLQFTLINNDVAKVNLED